MVRQGAAGIHEVPAAAAPTAGPGDGGGGALPRGGRRAVVFVGAVLVGEGVNYLKAFRVCFRLETETSTPGQADFNPLSLGAV